MIRKNLIKKKEERFRTKEVKLRDSLMYFQEESINFTDIEYENDIIEVSIGILNNTSAKKYKPSIVRVRDLVHGKEKEDIWTLNLQSIINVKYIITTQTVEDPLASINMDSFSDILTEKGLGAGEMMSKQENEKEEDTNKRIVDLKPKIPRAGLLRRESDAMERGSFKVDNRSRPPLTKASSLHFHSRTNMKPVTETDNSMKLSPKKTANVYSINSSAEVSQDSSPEKIRNLGYKINVDLDSSYTESGDLKSRKGRGSIFLQAPSTDNNLLCINSASTYAKETLDYEYITLDEPDMLAQDSFCEAFFIASLPKKNAKMLVDSEDYISPCKHKDCGILAAYKPDIIHRYKIPGNNRIDINSLTASMCFPAGIKICYSNDEKDVVPLKNFTNVITNEKGERFYVMNYHYYKKLDYTTFHEQYEVNPVKEYLQFKKVLPLLQVTGKKSNIETKLESNLQICTKFINNDNLYIPFTACLVSKYPFFQQMEKCLDTVIKMSMDSEQNPEEINKLISHLINEVPVPTNEKKLQFYIPYNAGPIEISGLKDKDVGLYDAQLLLGYLSIENISLVHHLMLMEQKLLFVANGFDVLSQVSEAFMALLYPLKWVNTYIPVLSEDMIKYLQSFMPFVMGIEESMLNTAKQYMDSDENIFIVYINKNNIDVYNNRKFKKLTKRSLCKFLPEMPEEVSEEVSNELKKLKKTVDQTKDKRTLDIRAMNKTVRELFVKQMISLYGDYKNYVSFIDEFPLFNTDIFLVNRSDKNHNFYLELANTQHFRQFLQNDSDDNKVYFQKMCTRYSSLINTKKKAVSKIKPSMFFKRSSSVSHKKSILINSSGGNGTTMNNTPNMSLHKGNSSYAEGNSDSNSKSGQSDIKNSHESSGVLMISPYFLNVPIIRSDSSRVEEILSEVYKHRLEPLEKKVLSFQQEFSLTSIPNTFKRYLVKTNQTKKSNKYSSPIKSMTPFLIDEEDTTETSDSGKRAAASIKANQLVKRSSFIMNETQSSTINTINELMKMILTSEAFKPSQVTSLQSLLGNRGARGYFAQCLFQEKFKQQKYQILSENSFSDLSRMIFIALLAAGDNPEQYEDIRLITKSMFFYYKNENTQAYYIYEEVCKKQGSFSVWLDDGYWLDFVDKEISEGSVATFVTTNKQDLYFTALLLISSHMNSLGISLKKILSCVVDNIAARYLCEESSVELVIELKTSIIKQYQNRERN